MKKRGSLQLGINTIVVLVIAMVLIAGGIVFIRTFLDNASRVIDPYFNPEDFPNQASSAKPVVFAQTSKFSIKSGDEIIVPIGLYNNLGTSKSFNMIFADCATGIAEYQTLDNNVDHPVPTIIAGDITLEPGVPTVKKMFVQAEDKDYVPKNAAAGVTAPTDLEPGNYICNFKVYVDDGTKTNALDTSDTILGQVDAIIEVVS